MPPHERVSTSPPARFPAFPISGSRPTLPLMLLSEINPSLPRFARRIFPGLSVCDERIVELSRATIIESTFS